MLKIIKTENPLESFTPEQVLDLFETNYRKAQKDAKFDYYSLYFKQKLSDSTFKDAAKYNGFDNYFSSNDKSSIIYYNRNPLVNYKISFPNENYYLWRIMVKKLIS